MSPERLDPNQFGLEDSRPTKESDCYALGMVILEVLSGEVPFKEDSNNYIVTQKVLEGKHPGRPRGAGAVRFTNSLWRMLERCWSLQIKDRPTAKDVLERFESEFAHSHYLLIRVRASDVAIMFRSAHPPELREERHLDPLCRRPQGKP